MCVYEFVIVLLNPGVPDFDWSAVGLILFGGNVSCRHFIFYFFNLGLLFLFIFYFETSQLFLLNYDTPLKPHFWFDTQKFK